MANVRQQEFESYDTIYRFLPTTTATTTATATAHTKEHGKRLGGKRDMLFAGFRIGHGHKNRSWVRESIPTNHKEIQMQTHAKGCMHLVIGAKTSKRAWSIV